MPKRVLAACLGLLALAGAACRGGGPVSATASSPGSLSALPAPAKLHVRRASFRLPYPVQREVAGTVSGLVYLAGGLDPSDVSISDVIEVDLAGGTARVAGHVPDAFHDAAGAVIAGRLFVFAGGSGQVSDVVQSFDPATGEGRLEGSMPVPLSDLSSAEVGGVVYLVGGYDGVAPRREIYSTRDGRHFKVVGMLPLGLRYPAVTAAGSAVVIAGGQTATGFTDRVMTFDPSTGKVRTIGHLPQPLAHAAAFTLGGLVYVAGGRTEADSAVRAVERVDLTAGTVRRAGQLPSPLADPGVVVEGGSVWLFGGWRGTPVSEVVVATLSK